AFRLIRECYTELDRPPGVPLARWDDAFKKANFVGLEEYFANEWRLWTIDFFSNSDNPGDPGNHDPLWTAWFYVKSAMKLIIRLLESLPGAGLDLARFVLEGAEAMAHDARHHTPDQHADLLKRLEEFLDRLRKDLQERSKTDVEIWRLWCVIELSAANVRGIIADRLLIDGFDAIDAYDYRQWLKKHGAPADVVDHSAVLRGLYDLVFAYQDGDPSQPIFAAGQALRSVCRIFFTYKGAIFWKMQAGMGDVVFAPLYEVLKKRGVQFRFFHRVTNLRLSEDKKSIAAIDMARQVTLIDEAKGYQPLVDVNGLPCWLAEPLYDQLREGAELREKSRESLKTYGYNLYNLESFWTKWQDVGRCTLKASEDFDRVVLGISLAALPYISQELMNNKDNLKWKDMVENIRTVQTQAFQIWLSEDMEQVGWVLPQIDLSGYVEPFDTWADMRQLITRESWPPEQQPKGIAYFCNAMPTPPTIPPADDHHFPIQQGNSVKEKAIRFLSHDVGVLWPKAVQATDFRWDLLIGGGARVGEERFASQFWRANIDPTERYVQSVPKSNQYRLKTNETGYLNLYIVGDWIDCGFNAGCIEATVMAGMEASHAICGSPKLEEISGYNHP
ncbi:MAG: hypothetical protein AB7P69_12640, partial [Candidatus Binatia bacterium]